MDTGTSIGYDTDTQNLEKQQIRVRHGYDKLINNIYYILFNKTNLNHKAYEIHYIYK